MKFRFTVEEAITRRILTRDLEVQEPTFTKNLSAPAELEFTLRPGTTDIHFKAYGQLIHVELETAYGVRVLLGSCLVQPGDPPDENGQLKIKARGFAGYPEGIPWLENWNPVTVDPFQIVVRMWQHIQNQPQGNMNVVVTPTSSGTYLVPGFSFDGLELIIEFFAYYLRANDLRDCADEMNKMARDIPFDYIETSVWNAARTQVDKTLKLAYPRAGVQRNNIVFRLGENVLQAQAVAESQIDWVSEIRARGWWPGKLYRGEFTVTDPTRFRRVLMEDDVQLNSKERAAIWAKRKLTRRQIPPHWDTIVVDAYHPHAPLGQWDLGDDILVQGEMPWHGKVSEWHRIMGYTITTGGTVQIAIKHKDAFNYDPIDFEG